MSESGLSQIGMGGSTPSNEVKLHVFRPDHSDDTMLWNSFRAGDEQALVAIFDRSIRPLHNYGVKIINDSDLVKDSVQELFIELWKNRKNLGDTNSIKAYLYKSLRRKLFRLKADRTNKLMVGLPAEYVNQTSPSAEFNLVAEQSSVEQRQHVMHLLNALTKRQREAIFLRYFVEMEYDKIASVMDLSKQVLYNLVHKAIGSLRERGMAPPAFLLILFCCCG